MHNHSGKIIFLIFSFLSVSCACNLYPEFKITDYSHNEKQICITFSQKPNVEKLKNSFLCIEDETQVTGTFEENDKTVIFYPAEGIKTNHNYKIIISTTSEDTKGISLENKFLWNFSTKETDIPLSVLSFNQDTEGITIDFSNAVIPEMFEKSFSLSPSVPHLTRWNENNTSLKLIYLEALKANTRYFAKISNTLTDIYNNTLKNDYQYNFLNKPKDEPDFKFLCNDNDSSIVLSEQCDNTLIHNDSNFSFEFTDNFDLEKFSSALSVFPPVKFQFNIDELNPQILNLELLETPAFNSKYVFTISNEFSSALIETRTYNVTFNNPDNFKPEFIQGIISTKNKNIFFNKENQATNVILPVDFYPTAETVSSEDIFVYFIFKTSQTSEINLSSAIENISISTTNTCIDFRPFDIELISESELPEDCSRKISTISLDESQKISIIKISSHVQNQSRQGIIKFQINKDLKDTNSNTLSSSINFFINKS